LRLPDGAGGKRFIAQGLSAGKQPAIRIHGHALGQAGMAKKRLLLISANDQIPFTQSEGNPSVMVDVRQYGQHPAQPLFQGWGIGRHGRGALPGAPLSDHQIQADAPGISKTRQGQHQPVQQGSIGLGDNGGNPEGYARCFQRPQPTQGLGSHSALLLVRGGWSVQTDAHLDVMVFEQRAFKLQEIFYFFNIL
jgi:hypothetical protein